MLSLQCIEFLLKHFSKFKKRLKLLQVCDSAAINLNDSRINKHFQPAHLNFWVFGIALHHDPPEAGDGDDGADVDEVQDGDDGQEDEPEPEEDEDLLVDDVGGEHAEGVVLLQRAGVTVLVEGTLGQPERR